MIATKKTEINIPMNKKIVAPLIVFIVSLLAGAFILFLTATSSNHGFFAQEIEQYNRQKEDLAMQLENIKQEKNQLLANETVDSLRIMAFDQEINHMQLVIRELDNQLDLAHETKTQQMALEKQQQNMQLVLGIASVLIVSLILAIVAFFAQRLFKNSNVANHSKRLIVFFVISLFFMLLSLGENEDGAAICFAILAGSALLSHTLAVLKSNH